MHDRRVVIGLLAEGDLSLTLPDPGWHGRSAIVAAASVAIETAAAPSRMSSIMGKSPSLNFYQQQFLCQSAASLPFQINQLLHERFRGSS